MSVYVSVYYFFLDYMLDNPVVMMVVGLLHLIGAVLLYLKKKSDEEIAEDGDDIGNRKLVPVVSRHGAGLEEGDYINISMKGDIARIKENKTRNEIKKSRRSEEQGFEHDASSVQSA